MRKPAAQPPSRKSQLLASAAAAFTPAKGAKRFLLSGLAKASRPKTVPSYYYEAKGFTPDLPSSKRKQGFISTSDLTKGEKASLKFLKKMSVKCQLENKRTVKALADDNKNRSRSRNLSITDEEHKEAISQLNNTSKAVVEEEKRTMNMKDVTRILTHKEKLKQEAHPDEIRAVVNRDLKTEISPVILKASDISTFAHGYAYRHLTSARLSSLVSRLCVLFICSMHYCVFPPLFSV